MKKKWIIQFISMIIYFIYYIFYTYEDVLRISPHVHFDCVLMIYHLVLFLIVTNVLLPRFLYKRKFLLFSISLLILMSIWGIIEEGVIEKIFYTNSRGRDAVTFESIFLYWGEIFAPLLAFTSIEFIFDNFEKQKKIELIQKNNLTNELKFLKSQIQPHVLFNSMNNLYHFTLEKSDKAPELVLQLSDVLRYVLYETSDTFTTLEKEIQFLEKYIYLQKIQFEERGIINFNTNIDETEKIPPFLLIPFIENCFKHGANTLTKDIKVTITLSVEKNKLHLSTINNFDNESKQNDLIIGGIGLKNVQKRLDLLYPKQYTLNYDKQDNIFKLDLTIKL